MKASSRAKLVAIGGLVFVAGTFVLACAGGEDLNPQPLPPAQGGGNEEPTPGDDNSSSSGGIALGPADGGAIVSAPADPDAGDAGDAGDDGGVN